MTLEEQYSRACNPPRWTILGFALRAYCYGHDQLLAQMELGDDITPAELVVAIRVCSMRYEEARRYLARGDKSLRARWAILAIRIRPILFHTAVELFRAYIADAKREVLFWSDPKVTRGTTLPPLALARREMIRAYGYTDSDLLNLPYGRIEIERLALVEAGGGIDFIDPEVIEQAQEMARQVFAEEEAAQNGSRR